MAPQCHLQSLRQLASGLRRLTRRRQRKRRGSCSSARAAATRQWATAVGRMAGKRSHARLRPVVVKKNRGGACVVRSFIIVKSRKSVTPSSAILKSNQIHDFEVRTSLRTVWNWIVITFLFSGNFAKIRPDFVSQTGLDSREGSPNFKIVNLVRFQEGRGGCHGFSAFDNNAGTSAIFFDNNRPYRVDNTITLLQQYPVQAWLTINRLGLCARARASAHA